MTFKDVDNKMTTVKTSLAKWEARFKKAVDENKSDKVITAIGNIVTEKEKEKDRWESIFLY